MIYLIGINHKLQHEKIGLAEKQNVIREFLQYVESTAEQFQVTTIAEEWSEEASEINEVEFSTVQTLARKLGLKHILCDPTTEERMQNNIGKKDFDRREEFWFKRLHRVLHENILFICGDQHLESFTRKLESKSISAEIVSSGWGNKEEN